LSRFHVLLLLAPLLREPSIFSCKFWTRTGQPAVPVYFTL
jgi:hypothetical protein